MSKTAESPLARTWLKFKTDKLAFGSLIFIFCIILLSIAGSLITPDDTPMANDMHLSLSTQKPGFSSLFLRTGSAPAEKVPFWEKMLYGEPNTYKDIPVSTYRLDDKEICIVEHIPGSEDSVYMHFTFEEVLGAELYRSDPDPRETILNERIIKRVYWLGTDRYGRDMLSRVIAGARVSLSVGLIAVMISLLVGVVLGAFAGFYRGATDAVISWLINVVWSLPTLLLVIAFSFALGKGFWQIFVAIGLSMWVEVARMVRGQILGIRTVEYVEAARAMGMSNLRIIFRHILPNISGPLLVVASSNFAAAILLEAGLSFLGFGAQPPMPTWGGMIKEHYGYIILDAAYLALIPGIAIMLIVYAFNLISIGLRDAMDTKAQFQYI